MRSPTDDPAAQCPVDHKAREAWMQAAQSQSQSQPQSQAPPARIPEQPKNEPATSHPLITTIIPPRRGPNALPVGHPAVTPPEQGSKLLPVRPGLSRIPGAPRDPSGNPLGTDREVSSIPRSFGSAGDSSYGQTAMEAAAAPTGDAPVASHGAAAKPANNEQETGTSSTGNWIYPSEKMFFDALKRKQFEARREDMRTIVPIHNAVNERVWREILTWEGGKAKTCGGPKLVSFTGLSSVLTPRARWNTLLGYQAPFDRHDWVVDRCGQEVEYVIDFYMGREEGKAGKPINFYLDVRPKLNTWEGWKMRFLRFCSF